jgi:gas vesicle protein
MTNNPDEIRADIEATRRDLGSDVDALADKVTPSKIAQRQTRKVRSAFSSVKDRVMGAADDAKGSASSAASSAGDTIADAGHTAVAKAQGNPLAVGLIAFGVGWLAASLIPASEKEKELGSSVKEAAQPLVQKVTDTAKEMADDLREPAQDAVNAVKDSATDAVQSVKGEASSAVGDVKDQAGEAKHAVQENNS